MKVGETMVAISGMKNGQGEEWRGQGAVAMAISRRHGVMSEE